MGIGFLRTGRTPGYTYAAWPSGGIGRRSGLKIRRPLKASRFESGVGHSPELLQASSPRVQERPRLLAERVHVRRPGPEPGEPGLLLEPGHLPLGVVARLL